MVQKIELCICFFVGNRSVNYFSGMQVKMPVGVLVFCHDGGKYSLNVLFGAPRSISGEIKKKNRLLLRSERLSGGGGVGGEWGWEVADNFDLVLKMHPHFKTF